MLLFTLGLNAGTFVGPLGTADAKLKAFIGSAIGLGAVIEGVQKVLERGAGLAKLSDQTDTSIASLYRIQRGLQYIGLGAEDAGNMIFMLNKSLGGINDNGEPTAAVFSQIGLSIDRLKKMDAPQQLLSIANAVQHLDSASATSAAGKIFGRFNAREFLELSANANEFADALRRGGVQAAIYDRFGHTFEKIHSLVGDLKENFSGIFLGLAAGVAPALENVVKMLDNLDLSKIGQWIGTFVTALTQAFREGTLSELIGDSLKLAFDTLLAYAPGVFEKIGFFLLKAFATPLEYLQAGMEYALQEAANVAMSKMVDNKLFRLLFAHDPVAGEIMNQASQMAGNSSFSDMLADAKKNGPLFNLGSGDFNLDGINKHANDQLSAAQASMKDKWKNYGAELIGLASRAAQPDAARKSAGSKYTLGAGFIPEHTALEKMGFVFRGGAGADPSTQTARNTSRMVGLLQNISDKMNGTHGGEGNFGLTNLPAI